MNNILCPVRGATILSKYWPKIRYKEVLPDRYVIEVRVGFIFKRWVPLVVGRGGRPYVFYDEKEPVNNSFAFLASRKVKFEFYG